MGKTAVGAASMGPNGKKPKMSSTVEAVTPAMATEWLQQNYETNRPLRHVWVEQLAARMRAGHWEVTHQGIGFDTEGRLIDGQHRLWAIIEANLPIEIMVSRNVPPGAFGVLDQHRVRSVADLAGDPWITPRIVGSARAMARGPSQNHTGAFDDRDPTLMLVFIAEQRETMERVHALLPVDKRARGRSNLTAVVMGVLYRASLHVSLKKLQRFIDVYTSGVSHSDTESAAILLRDWIMGTQGKDRTVTYQKAQRAVAAFVDEDPIKILYASPDDLFPLPTIESRAPRKIKGKDRTQAKRRRADEAKRRKKGDAP